jgi:hypothetical protein
MWLLDNVLQRVAAVDFWQGVVAAFVLALLGFVAKRALRWGRAVFGRPWDFNIAGYWVGTCYLPSYRQPHLELWRYARNREEVRLVFFAYDPASGRVTKWRGGGVLRGHMLSAHYYLSSKYAYDTGVIALELQSECLKGVYAQFHRSESDDQLFVSSTEPKDFYRQCRAVDLPVAARIRMFCGRRPFKTYKEIEALYIRSTDDAEATEPTPPSAPSPSLTIPPSPSQPN